MPGAFVVLKCNICLNMLTRSFLQGNPGNDLMAAQSDHKTGLMYSLHQTPGKKSKTGDGSECSNSMKPFPRMSQ